VQPLKLCMLAFRFLATCPPEWETPNKRLCKIHDELIHPTVQAAVDSPPVACVKKVHGASASAG